MPSEYSNIRAAACLRKYPMPSYVELVESAHVRSWFADMAMGDMFVRLPDECPGLHKALWGRVVSFRMLCCMAERAFYIGVMKSVHPPSHLLRQGFDPKRTAVERLQARQEMHRIRQQSNEMRQLANAYEWAIANAVTIDDEDEDSEALAA